MRQTELVHATPRLTRARCSSSHIEQWIPILFGLGSSPLFLLEFVREFQTAHDLYPLLDHEPLATDASGLIDGGYIRLKLPLHDLCGVVSKRERSVEHSAYRR